MFNKNFTNSRRGGGQYVLKVDKIFVLQKIYRKFLNLLNRFRRSHCGAILIDFAFSIPVFLALIYYIHDVPKVKALNRRTQFVANEIAMILQNLSKKRTMDEKKINVNDMSFAVRMANLSAFSGTMQYALETFRKMPRGYMGLTLVYYVVGRASGKAEVKWWYRIHPNTDALSGYAFNKNQTDREEERLVNTRGTTPSAIYPGLKLSEGEVKIIVEYCLHTYPEITSLSGYGSASPGELFGFLFYRPSTAISQYFGHVAIFKPQGNAFTETIP